MSETRDVLEKALAAAETAHANDTDSSTALRRAYDYLERERQSDDAQEDKGP